MTYRTEKEMRIWCVALTIFVTSLITCPLVSGNEESSGFLKTDYKPLANWLEERFEIDYRQMTPSLIFDQVPLSDIFYKTTDLPEGLPPFNLRSPSISRRELLERIADHWQFEMYFSLGDDGNPDAVIVRPRLANEI